MADPGKRLESWAQERIRKLAKEGKPIKQIARLQGHSKNTVKKYLRQGVEP